MLKRVVMLVMGALLCATSAMAAEPTGTLKKIKDRAGLENFGKKKFLKAPAGPARSDGESDGRDRRDLAAPTS
jgi:hypothetical protein